MPRSQGPRGGRRVEGVETRGDGELDEYYYYHEQQQQQQQTQLQNHAQNQQAPRQGQRQGTSNENNDAWFGTSASSNGYATYDDGHSGMNSSFSGSGTTSTNRRLQEYLEEDSRLFGISAVQNNNAPGNNQYGNQYVTNMYGHGNDGGDGGMEYSLGEVEAESMALWSWRRRAKLLGLLSLLILSGSAETISYTVNGKVLMAPYRCFLDQAVVLTCIIFFTALYGIEEARRRRSQIRRWLDPRNLGRENSRGRSEGTESDGEADYYAIYDDEDYDPYNYGNRQSPEVRRRNAIQRARSFLARGQFYWLVAVMALCDTIALYINLLASHDLGGALRLILQQLSIPMSMGLSTLMLNRVFSKRHFIGAVMVLLGVILCLINVMQGGPGQSDARWTVVFAISCLPLALGGCLKEWVLTQPRFDCDAHQLNAWVAVFQFFFGICLVPLGIWIQNRDMDETSQVPSDEIMTNFLYGFKCGFLGINSYDPLTGLPAYGKEDCASAVISTWMYIGMVCAFNMLMLIVIDEGSAVLFFVANGVIIPVVSVASASPLYSRLNLPRDTYTPWQFIGLTFTVAGCFYFGKAVIQRAEDERKQEILRSGGTSNRSLSSQIMRDAPGSAQH